MAYSARMISQLRALLPLTRTEAQVARIRVAQARTEAVRRELNENAGNADERAQAIATELRRLGDVTDVVSPAVGRIGALVKGTLDQAGPVDEALLGDLALEHQLADRARYLRSVAVAAKDARVEKLADRLLEAHTATVEWLTVVLAEDALGGPAALRPTPLQVVAGGVGRAVNLPVRIAREQVNRVVGLVQSSGEELATQTQRVAGKAAQFSENARDVALTGRAAALDRAEDLARRDGATDAARTLHARRAQLGTLDESELPIAGYDGLGKNEAVDAIKKLETADALNAVLRYEEAHKNRQGVVSATQTRYAALAKDVAGVE